ncbi:MAG: hypothetical protein AB1705_11890 [Verrucomicrobiota bacterium]
MHTQKAFSAGALWSRLAQLRLGWRAAIKVALFALVLVAVLYPHPIFLAKQIGNLRNLEGLIQPDLPEMAQINQEIDKSLPDDCSPRQEYKAVERYVYQRIKYQYDWYNWGNLDYWPTAQEVWQRQKEDCDGRAVMAVSILRSRGFETAKLVGNLNHIWVAVDNEELMGPQEDKNFKREGGKTKLSLPSRKTLLDSLAMVSKFPVVRSLVIFFAALVLCYHPGNRWGRFFGLSTIGLAGFLLLLDWANLHLANEVAGVNFNCVAGLSLIGASLVAACVAGHSRRPQ